jgi:hypothetical protein
MAELRRRHGMRAASDEKVSRETFSSSDSARAARDGWKPYEIKT